MKKRTFALIMALVLMLSVAIPGTLAVSLDGDSTEATFSLDTDTPVEEAPVEEAVEEPAEEVIEEDVEEAPVEEGEDIEETPAEEPAEPEEDVNDSEEVKAGEEADEETEETKPEEEPEEENTASEITLPECTCPEDYAKQLTYDHKAECLWSLGNLYQMSEAQLELWWQSLTTEEQEWLAGNELILKNNGVTEEQIEQIKQLEETKKKQDYCETITDVTDTEHGVTVSGVPAGVTLSVSVPTGYDDAIVALDITLKDASGNDWQPYLDEEFQKYTDGYVALSLDLSQHELPDGTVVTLNHTHDGKTTEYLYVVIDGKITFYTDSFSIYVVNSTTATSGTQVNAGGTYGMTVDDEKIFYYKTANSVDGHNNPKLIGAVWSITDESNAVTYTEYDNAYNASSSYYTWKAQWIKITAKNAGTVTVTATCYYSYTTNNGGDKPGQGGGTTTKYATTTETFTINVSEKLGFHIEDKIAETGCLVPVWDSTEDSAADGWEYTWTRSDNQPVRSDALPGDGTVNVSLDRGGVTNGREPITYTVTATKEDGTTQTASFKVIYGQEILNPSFETPGLSALNTTQRAFYNGYEGLYWKTTAPGTGDKLGLDVELWTPDFGQTHGGPTTTPDKLKQYAELNAEKAGTLYQDMLTTSGATLSWSFSHAGRTNASNKMYIVIAATKNAQSITDNEDIKELIAEAGEDIPVASTSATGKTFTYNGGTYVIWEHTAEEKQWSTLSGTYTVPEGQYLTRLFFAADPNDEGNNTLGNFIDGVDAGEKMSYKIEYYPGGTLANDKTESGNGTVYTTVSLKNLQSYLDDGYVITSVKVNGKDYSGDIKNGLYITDYGTVENQDVNIRVQITLRQKAITVTKVVTIDGWDSMTDDEREVLVEGYEATFGLYKENSETATATTTLTVSGVASDGTVTVMGEFVPNDGVQNGTYTVKETSAKEITGYTLDSTTYSGGTVATDGKSITVTISDTNPTAAVIVTNHYKIGVTSLTITKKAGDNTTFDANDTFVFKITGTDGYRNTVVIQGAGNVTINGLKVGETYTVEEDTSWSWRYKPTDGNASKTVTLVASGNTVTFTNSKTNNKWLDGNASVVNKYDKNKGN